MNKAIDVIRENKGKSLLIAGIILMWVILGVLFKNYGYEETWKLWRIPVEEHVFLDFRLIPGSAESFRNGFEPSVNNPSDPGKRIFNYPAFWRLFFYTNISMDDTIWIVIAMLILYFFGVVLFPERLSVPGALLMLLIVFSPASMLLYERGNVDLIIFFICAMTVFATGYTAHLAAGLIVIGAIMKMFPLFGFTVLLKESKPKFILLAASSIVFVLIYGWVTIESQSAAWNTTMRGDGISYGSFVLITRLGGYLQELFPGLLTFSQWEILFEALALVLIIVAGILAVRQPVSLEPIHERNLSAFRMGAAIYIGTFLLGNNWDYRLAFLVFVVPQLAEWVYLAEKRHRIITILVISLVLISCWHFKLQIDLPILPLKDISNRIVIVDEVFNWLLLPGLTYLLAASFPVWLKQDLQKVFGVRTS